jgi:hypothetical protein
MDSLRVATSRADELGRRFLGRKFGEVDLISTEVEKDVVLHKAMITVRVSAWPGVICVMICEQSNAVFLLKGPTNVRALPSVAPHI